MRSAFFGPEASTAPVTEALKRAYPEFRSHELDIRDAEGGRAAVRRARRRRSRSSSTPPPSPRTTGPRASRRPTSASTPTAPSTCSRPPGRTARTRRSSSARPTRSTATRRTGCRSRTCRHAPGAARGPPLLPGHRHDDVDRPLDPLAVRRLEGRGRPAGPGVRALLRHADGLLPRRLPHRPPARRRQAARLPRLPDEVRRHRDAVHRLRLRGQAGARQHPQRRPGRRLRGLPRATRGPRPSTTSAAGGCSNCSMLEAIEACERIAGRELEWEMGPEPRIGDHRWWISDLGAVRGRLPGLVDRATGSRRSCTEMYEQNLERWMATVG